MKCPRCGRLMKRYKNTPETEHSPDKQMWGCKMHYGKWGVWVEIQGLKAAGRSIK